MLMGVAAQSDAIPQFLQYLNSLQAYTAAVTNCANAGGGLVSWNSLTEQVSLPVGSLEGKMSASQAFVRQGRQSGLLMCTRGCTSVNHPRPLPLHGMLDAENSFPSTGPSRGVLCRLVNKPSDWAQLVSDAAAVCNPRPMHAA